MPFRLLSSHQENDVLPSTPSVDTTITWGSYNDLFASTGAQSEKAALQRLVPEALLQQGTIDVRYSKFSQTDYQNEGPFFVMNVRVDGTSTVNMLGKAFVKESMQNFDAQRIARIQEHIYPGTVFGTFTNGIVVTPHPQRSVDELLDEEAEDERSLATILEYCRSVLQGLVDMRAKGITHGDYTPGNVLHAPEQRGIVIDWTTAELCTLLSEHNELFPGTQHFTHDYSAPDHYHKNLNPHTDTFSAGQSIVDIATDETLVQHILRPCAGGVSLKEMITTVQTSALQTEVRRALSSVSEPLADLVCQMVPVEPEKRIEPTMALEYLEQIPTE